MVQREVNIRKLNEEVWRELCEVTILSSWTTASLSVVAVAGTRVRGMSTVRA